MTNGQPNTPRTRLWSPQPGPQKALVDCPLAEIFFGGARGGGKTDGVLGKWAIKERRYGKAFNAMMFRRTTVSSEDAIERAKQLYLPLGAKFVGSPIPRFSMPNGGRITFAYLDSMQDAEQYQGRNLTDAWVEEAGQYPDSTVIDRLYGVLRSASGVPVQLILTANPGGAGQGWISQRYGLVPFPKSPKVVTRVLDDGATHRMAVIPSRITDNRILLDSDPGYLTRLKMVGGSALVKAWLDGDWSAIEGAFFDVWSEQRHVLDPFKLPDDWARFRSGDWGSAKPFSFGWWAIVGDDTRHPVSNVLIPRGAIVRYREWYGCVPGKPNTGLKLTAEQVGAGIAERETEKVVGGVLDPAAFAEDGGPSIASRITVGSGAKKVMFRPADNKRVSQRGAMGGWDMMRQRLIGTDEAPMIFCFSTCKDSIRTIPMLQHDQARPEDLDSNLEDHAADEWRYACMSRPWVRDKAAEPKKQFSDYRARENVASDNDWITY
jgi:hypothetical protein